MSQFPAATPGVGERREPASLGADDPPRVRGELHRKTLADARHRAALARHMGLTGTDVLAIQHLARAGQLTAGQLSALLQLSSAGTTAVIRRLQHAGHITRHPHAADGRGVVLRLAPTVLTSASKALAPYITELDALIAALSDTERDLIEHFLRRAADAAERHTDDLTRQARDSARDALAVPLPALWA